MCMSASSAFSFGTFDNKAYQKKLTSNIMVFTTTTTTTPSTNSTKKDSLKEMLERLSHSINAICFNSKPSQMYTRAMCIGITFLSLIFRNALSSNIVISMDFIDGLKIIFKYGLIPFFQISA